MLKSGQTPETVTRALRDGRITPLTPAPEIDEALIHSCTNIVALAGAEQIAAALATGADIVIAGRTTDTAIIAALPLVQGCHPGGAWHGAKIGECGAICTTNPASGVIMVDFDADGFTIQPLADKARATPHTVSAHMLYENSDPFILYEPGGHLDVTGSTYTAPDRSLRPCHRLEMGAVRPLYRETRRRAQGGLSDHRTRACARPVAMSKCAELV